MKEIGIIDFQGKPWIVGTRFSKMYTTMSCFSRNFYSATVCLLPLTKIPLTMAISFAILEQSRVILSFEFLRPSWASALYCNLHYM